MKKLILLLVALLPAFIYAQQTEWSDAEKEVLNKFNLSSNDFRGVVFSKGTDKCNISSENALQGLESFFNSAESRDLTTICISSEDANNFPLETAFDIQTAVKYYIELTKDQNK